MNTPFEVNRPTTGALASYITEELLSAIWLIGGLTLVTGQQHTKARGVKLELNKTIGNKKKAE